MNVYLIILIILHVFGMVVSVFGSLDLKEKITACIFIGGELALILGAVGVF